MDTNELGAVDAVEDDLPINAAVGPRDASERRHADVGEDALREVARRRRNRKIAVALFCHLQIWQLNQIRLLPGRTL